MWEQSPKDMYKKAHSGAICNNQNLAKVQMSIKTNEKLWYSIYNRILFTDENDNLQLHASARVSQSHDQY